MPSIQYSSSYSVSYWGSITAYVRLTFSESYNQTTNQTTLSLTGLEFKKAGSTNVGSIPVYGSISVDGQSICTIDNTGSGKISYVSLSGDGWCSASLSNVTRNSAVVTHNADGAKNVTVTVTAGNSSKFCCMYRYNYDIKKWQNVPFGVPSQSGTMALTTRPRGSSISSCTNPATTGSSLTLNVARNSTAFNHVATFSSGNTTLYTSDRFDTSLSLTVPRSWFASFPNAASLPVTVSVQTYSGNTTIGNAVTTNITVIADADMKPVVSSGWATLSPYNTGVIQNITGYVKGYSQASVTFDDTHIDMTAAVGASIASYSVTCQGDTISASPYRTGVLTSLSVPITCTVTDTRGRTASESFTLTVMDYANPTITGQRVFRCDDQGVADEDGSYISVQATVTVSSLNGQNTGTLKYAYKAAGGSYGAFTSLTSGVAAIVGPLSADTSYAVQIEAEDSLGNTAVYYATIPTRKWAMKFRSDGNGVAFGKAAETDRLFEITDDWDVQIGGDLTVLGSINGGGGGGGGGSTMYFPSQTVNAATNAEIFRITNGAITTQTVVVECTFASPSSITSDVTWTSYDGYIAFYGTCTSATTADVALGNATVPTPETPLSIAKGGTGASTAAGAIANLGIGRVLVWENPNPTSSFAPGAVNVSLSEYSYIQIECFRTDSVAQSYFTDCAIGTSDNPVVASLSDVRLEMSSGTNSITIISRTADIYPTGVLFHEGNMVYNGSSYSTWNNRAIPYRIWGIR